MFFTIICEVLDESWREGEKLGLGKIFSFGSMVVCLVNFSISNLAGKKIQERPIIYKINNKKYEFAVCRQVVGVCTV